MQGRLRHSNSFKVKIKPNADEYKANLCTVSRLLRPLLSPLSLTPPLFGLMVSERKTKFPMRGPFSVPILNIKLRR